MNKYSMTEKGAVVTLESHETIKLFVTSDVHFDSAHCNRAQFFTDLQEGIEEGAKIVIVGDFFDAMQGRFDPRRDMSHLRPEYRRPDYYDYIVEDAARLLKPYAQHIILITDGNHELSVLKNANTDITGRLVSSLSTARHSILRGGYGGIILVKNNRYTTPIKYFHGSGGESPVTRGAIQTNRQAVFLPDFQIVLNGHSHNTYWIPISRERVTEDGHHYFDLQHHVRTPGYAMTYGNGSGGWEVTRGGVPKPIGSSLIKIKEGEVFATPMVHAPTPIDPIIDLYQGMIFPQE